MNIDVAAIIAPKKRTMDRYNGVCARCKRRHSVGLRLGSEVNVFAIGAEESLYYSGATANWVMVTEHGHWLPVSNNVPVVFCCDREVRFVPVKGKFNLAHKCDARCMASKGHVCDCACGGQNHGASWSG